VPTTFRKGTNRKNDIGGYGAKKIQKKLSLQAEPATVLPRSERKKRKAEKKKRDSKTILISEGVWGAGGAGLARRAREEASKGGRL